MTALRWLRVLNVQRYASALAGCARLVLARPSLKFLARKGKKRRSCNELGEIEVRASAYTWMDWSNA